MNSPRQSDINNPVRYIEELYTEAGIQWLSLEASNRTIGNSPHDYYDEVNDEYIQYQEDPITGETYKTVFTYEKFCKSLLSSKRQTILINMQDRMDSTNSIEERKDVLTRMLNKLKKAYMFIHENSDTIPRFHADYVYNLAKLLKQKHSENESIPNPKVDIKPKLTNHYLRLNLNDRLVFVENLKQNDIIRCRKNEISKVNYYFDLSSSSPEPTDKILWLKSPALLHYFIKYALKGKGKYTLASQIFSIPEISSETINQWGGSKNRVAKIHTSEAHLRKVLTTPMSEEE